MYRYVYVSVDVVCISVYVCKVQKHFIAYLIIYSTF